jgi:hypothetical protein
LPADPAKALAVVVAASVLMVVGGVINLHTIASALRNPCEKYVAYMDHLDNKYGEEYLAWSTQDEGRKLWGLHVRCNDYVDDGHPDAWYDALDEAYPE